MGGLTLLSFHFPAASGHSGLAKLERAWSQLLSSPRVARLDRLATWGGGMPSEVQSAVLEVGICEERSR